MVNGAAVIERYLSHIARGGRLRFDSGRSQVDKEDCECLDAEWKS